MTKNKLSTNFTEGLLILVEKYEHSIQTFDGGEVWCRYGNTVSPEDEAKLKELGWKPNILPKGWWFDLEPCHYRRV